MSGLPIGANSQRTTTTAIILRGYEYDKVNNLKGVAVTSALEYSANFNLAQAQDGSSMRGEKFSWSFQNWTMSYINTTVNYVSVEESRMFLKSFTKSIFS